MRKKYLLILSCSARKRSTHAKVRAWELYEGVAFKLLKRRIKEKKLSEKLDILILSALYGLIRAEEYIEWYDKKMTCQDAAAQAEKNAAIMRQILRQNSYEEVFIFGGRTYLAALQPVESWLPVQIKLHVASGGIGQKLKQLREWLENITAKEGE